VLRSQQFELPGGPRRALSDENPGKDIFRQPARFQESDRGRRRLHARFGAHAIHLDVRCRGQSRRRILHAAHAGICRRHPARRPTGVGALAGAIFLASRSRLKGLAEVIVIAGTLYGVGLVALSFSRFLSIALIIALVLGFSLMMQMASSNTIVQSIVDDQKRGRVLSFFVMARRGVESLGSLLFGVIANWVGTPGTLMIGGAVCLLAVAAFATQLSSIRQASHLFDEDKKRASRENA